jgi:hypothetical protein
METIMRALAILILGMTGCGETELTCTSWYNDCMCDYECADQAKYEEWLDEEAGQCDVACDTALPGPGTCAQATDKSCRWFRATDA